MASKNKCSHLLNKKLHHYIKNICDEVRKLRKGKKLRKKDYPNAACGCEYGGHCEMGHSQQSILTSSKVKISFHPILDAALQKFLDKGQKPPKVISQKKGKCVFVGTCAEDSAANKMLIYYQKQAHSAPLIKNLVFTGTIRPRTNQKLKPCTTCKTIFNL